MESDEEEDAVEEEIVVAEAQEVSSHCRLKPKPCGADSLTLLRLLYKQVVVVEEIGEVVVADEVEIVGVEVVEGATETSAEPRAHNCDITPLHRTSERAGE